MAVPSPNSMEEELVAAATTQQTCSTCNLASSSTTLLALPDDLLTLCLIKVDSIRDLATVAAACKRLAELALHSRQVWVHRCITYVDTPSAWLTASLSVHGDSRAGLHQSCAGQLDRAPTSFRGLYRLLSSLQPMVGFWRGVGDAPRGSLYTVSWGHDCIHVQQVQCSDSTKTVTLSSVLRLGPAYPLHTAELLGDAHLVIRQFRGQPRLPCAAAAAAAAVSAGGAFLPRKTRSRSDIHVPMVSGTSAELQVPTRSPARAPSPIALHNSVHAALTAAAAQPHGVSGSSNVTSHEHEHLHHVPGGFGHEVLKFMASQVAPPRGAARRRAQRDAARAALAASAATATMPTADAAQQGLPAAPPYALTAAAAAGAVPATDMATSSDSSSRMPASWHSSIGPGGRGVHGSSSSPSQHNNSSSSNSVVTGAYTGQLEAQGSDQGAAHSEGSTSSTRSVSDGLLASPGGLLQAQGAGKSSNSASVTASPGSSRTAPRSTPQEGAVTAAMPSQPHTALAQTQLEPVGPAVHTHHFVRMVVPQATRAHPLAGLWKGVYGPHGLEIISVAYDFSASQARVLGWKATGDHNVPAGQDTWWASAAPQPQPWSDHELRLQEARLWLSDAPQAQPAWHGVAPQAAQAAVQSLTTEPHEQRPALPRVVSSHVGCGRIAGHHYSNPQWVPGRLWVYDNGNIAFLYMWPGNEEEPMFMVDYTRVVL